MEQNSLNPPNFLARCFFLKSSLNFEFYERQELVSESLAIRGIEHLEPVQDGISCLYKGFVKPLLDRDSGRFLNACRLRLDQTSFKVSRCPIELEPELPNLKQIRSSVAPVRYVKEESVELRHFTNGLVRDENCTFVRLTGAMLVFGLEAAASKIWRSPPVEQSAWVADQVSANREA